MKLDRDSSTPLHVQLESIVRLKIDSGEWLSSAAIPTESELSQRFSVSRVTVRTVLDRLLSLGILHRGPGKSVLVTDASEKSDDTIGLSYTGVRAQLELPEEGFRFHFLGVERIQATSGIARALHIRNEDTVYVVRRVRLHKGFPVSIHTSHIPQGLAPGLHTFDLAKHLPCEILDQLYKRPLLRQTEALKTASVSSENLAILGISVPFLLLMLESIGYTTGDIPLEHSEIVFRGDRIKLRLEYGISHGRG